jgi:WD40 repeat protein
VNSVAISSDIKFIVSGSGSCGISFEVEEEEDNTIRVWERESGTQIQELKGHNDSVNSVAISSDNKFIVSGSRDETIRVWERESSKQIQELKGHNESVNSVALSSDNKFIVSGSGFKDIFGE